MEQSPSSINRSVSSFPGDAVPNWREAGLRYFTYNHYLRSKFGRAVRKVSIDGGFTCPNVDGTVTTGGCNFCDNRSFSPSRRVRRQDVISQIDNGIARLKRRYDCDDFMAYFQPGTNTYAPLDRLRDLYEAAAGHPQVVAMAIGTRPDCMSEDVVRLLEEIASQVPLTVELGIQSIHERSLRWMNRGHGYHGVPEVVARCRGRGFEVSAHLILGIPGESHDDMLQAADEMSRLGLDSIKLHNLYVVKHTELAEQLARGEVTLMERDAYVSTLIDFIERLPARMVVERVMGEAPPEYFVAPAWCLDKPAVLRAIQHEFERRDTWQGRCAAGKSGSERTDTA